MPKITVSYRRDDSEAITGRIFDRLIANYGKESVFRDIDNIPPGVDFRKHIDGALKETDVLMVVIGRRWLGSVKQGHARIHDEADPVRIEVETALQRGIPVIPILVGDTKMPTAAPLPPSLKDFAFRNAVRVDSGQDFDHHTDRLMRAMDRALPRDGKAESAGKASPAPAAPAPAAPASPQPMGLMASLEPARAERATRAPAAAVVTDGDAKARPEWGGYSKASVSELIGSYLVLRCTFKNPGNVFAYATDIFWDDAEGGLMFQERERLDAKHSHRGHVRIPNLSMYMYLVSGENGWLRSITVSVLDVVTEMHGLLSTLHNVAGAMYVPVVTPVVYIKRDHLAQETFGEITPADPRHEGYLKMLRQTITNTYVQMIVPGAP
jgi:TIR domain-containing protein